MLPMEVVDRVFRITVGESEGTAFALDVAGRQYLVTAKHVVEQIHGPTIIGIWHNNSWQSLNIELVGHSDVDVSVLAPKVRLADPAMKLETVMGGFYVAQDAYFAGFPLGIMGQSVESLFPTPLVKKAIISGKAGPGFKNAFLLDGHGNPGFSGGPVYLTAPGATKYAVAMVITSFTAQCDKVLDKRGKPTSLVVLQNSGIMAAFSVRNALDLIDSNPMGLPVS
jgi:hypothetical protein